MADLWPRYDGPEDLASVEAVSLTERGLPTTTFDALCRAATLWPERAALSTMPDAGRWREHSTVTFGGLLSDVLRAANLMHTLGVRRGRTVGLMSPNCDGGFADAWRLEVRP